MHASSHSILWHPSAPLTQFVAQRTILVLLFLLLLVNVGSIAVGPSTRNLSNFTHKMICTRECKEAATQLQASLIMPQATNSAKQEHQRPVAC